MTTIDNLDPELYYSVFVVALGGDLPSHASSMVNITEGIIVIIIIRIIIIHYFSTVQV